MTGQDDSGEVQQVSSGPEGMRSFPIHALPQRYKGTKKVLRLRVAKLRGPRSKGSSAVPAQLLSMRVAHVQLQAKSIRSHQQSRLSQDPPERNKRTKMARHRDMTSIFLMGLSVSSSDASINAYLFRWQKSSRGPQPRLGLRVLEASHTHVSLSLGFAEPSRE